MMTSSVEPLSTQAICHGRALHRTRRERFDKHDGIRHDDHRRAAAGLQEVPMRCRHWIVVVAALGVPAAAQASDIGQIKIASGAVAIERGTQSLRGEPGTRIQGSDIVKTGADGSVGITMTDNSLLSAGPNSVLVLDRYEFDSTTNQGFFDASLRRGTLAVVSGRLAKQSRDAVTVRTPSAILGVRGTEFVITVR
jgi:hypothetical protein